MGDVGIVATRFYDWPGSLQLESGARLGPLTIAYETYGELNAAGDNAILVLHALTGSAHIAGRHSPDDRLPGWWDPLVGPGRALDTRRYFVVCANVLGSCYGTTGPASINPASGRPYGLDFPIITIRDMVRAQKILLDYLGVKHLVAAIGGSMGGMQVLEWGFLYPEMVSAIIPIAACGRTTPMQIAFHNVQREAIYADPDWQGGDYYGTPGPRRGLALARRIGTITYKSDPSWTMKFGRTVVDPEKYYHLEGQFEVESYLAYQGRKLVQRFDANAYLYLTKAVDLHDVSRGRGNYTEVWNNLPPCLGIGISSDFLFPPYQVKEIVRLIKAGGGRARYRELNSPYGHDAFLIEFKQLEAIIKPYLAELRPDLSG
ncbi:homoserine O-acetyltransferase MetX [Neomoorella mulderi]|uniref:Homoserine O-acetyltransferase n=1 Tax=Moorella mulderi DSM 14980 TaxID=1122241 RepID=A0A151B079_9FIRM|nr:homoserine O-acetyltransferase [Moorella mulderi]KYH33057.1 homoserine O-acetyltransferase [Moorella mulderi DSM 14980]